MNESMLKALMQLFAIVAEVDGINDKSKATVKEFLESEVNQEEAARFLTIYDRYIKEHHFRRTKKDGKVKRTSRNAVKILRIAVEINKTLTRPQKLVVLIRLIEYIYEQNIVSERNLEFLQAIVDSFNVNPAEFEHLKKLISAKEEVIDPDENYITLGPRANQQKRIEAHKGLDINLAFLNLSESKVLVVRPLGNQELYVGGAPLEEGKVFVFKQGSSIRGNKISPIYFSDIMANYTNDSLDIPVVFTAEDVEFRFNKNEIGLHPLSFQATSGQLVGIMGGSGTGKSTLLNVLNGNNCPTSGKVLINHTNLHKPDEEIEGLIGYVPQDDLLIEDLTVFENLYFNAQLSFGNLGKEEITEIVLSTLNALGLEETKSLKVGNPLEKTISGGQRKRINIALELMREPPIMFIDEPTSGLSSRDSETIMDLLKGLTLKGKLIFVVIHQPSSEIFKMFDKLLILDKGGHLIYQGNPLDGISYFKNISVQRGLQSSDCATCGNVNPEQIFDVIEAKVVNEYGDLTDVRKRTPEDWTKSYQQNIEPKLETIHIPQEFPKADFRIPNLLQQFKVFVMRDVLSKLSNTQYLVINLLEAPALALIVAGFLRYKPSSDGSASYVFRENENILAYLFISVVVALFMGLTVSAEEIIRDQKIRKREAFLNLSKAGYLLSKITIQFVISAIQVFLYVSIGNYIIGIEGMTFNYWVILFSAACFANVTGLNISASFKNVVTIYILIPFIVIPQILFSGVLVKYDELNPWFSSKRGVPVIGNIMASRWAFEALAVEQTINNQYERFFFPINQKLYHFSFMKNYWLPEINASISAIENAIKKNTGTDEILIEAKLIYNEFSELPRKEIENFSGELQQLAKGEIKKEDLSTLNNFTQILNDYYGRMVNKYTEERDLQILSLKESLGGDDAFMEFKSKYENEQLWEFVNNKNHLTKIDEHNGELFRIENKAYLNPEEGIHHYYSPTKIWFGRTVSTFWYNVLMLWLATLTLMITLYFDVLKKAIKILSKLNPFQKE